ncbi:MAG TPA: helix-turn-helix domain-containing protein [Cyclobacteriaceae bacterium]|nr:helix-turn-helix domain-containing protein [Cyclobacteriaceae bacterium]
MKIIRKRSDCPVSSALDIIGDKWSLLVIRDIMLSGKNTYNGFLGSEEKIATNILADRLAMLEYAGILRKERHPQSKAKILYRISKKGIDLLPVLLELILWSDKYLPISAQARQFAREIRKDKEGIIKLISGSLKNKKKRR